MKILALFLFSISCVFQSLEGKEPTDSWGSAYQKVLLEKVGNHLPEFANYPSFHFPNKDHTKLLKLYPESKILLFGYGSLINKQSASRNVKKEAVESMLPVVAFGVKRIFNYQASKTDHWGSDQDRKEKAMLNLVPSLDINSAVNGVVMEIDSEDLASLITREKGYDLVPILIASWVDVTTENPHVEIKVAYTFIAPYEARERVIYTSTQYYPVKGYLHAIQGGASDYGQEFEDFWNHTTYLADGITSVSDWDEETFRGILCAKQAIDPPA